jgi:hypothetical protein
MCIAKLGFDSDWQVLLHFLVNPRNSPFPSPRVFPVIHTAIAFAFQELKPAQPEKVALLLSQLLGQGNGLTPLGDDFIIGFLLGLNCWQPYINPILDLASINHHLTELAYKSTTTLSANLIECATKGLSDERLVEACDQLATSPTPPYSAINRLLTWGNSSGPAAFAGLVAAFSHLLANK